MFCDVSVYVHVWIPFIRIVYRVYISCPSWTLRYISLWSEQIYSVQIDIVLLKCLMGHISMCTYNEYRFPCRFPPLVFAHTCHHFRMEITAFYFKQIDYYCMAKVLNKPTKFLVEWCKLDHVNKMRCAFRAINFNRSWQRLSPWHMKQSEKSTEQFFNYHLEVRTVDDFH